MASLAIIIITQISLNIFHLKILLHFSTLAICLLGICGTANAQFPEPKIKPLNGLVIHSENDESLAGVHIYAKIAHAGTVSDQRGKFNLLVDEHDTLIVTFVGYGRQVIPMSYFREDQIDMIIRMEYQTIQLDGVTIFGDPNIDHLLRPERNPMRIPGLQAPAAKPNVDVPVGSLNYGIMSRWGKEAKEKRKLMEVYSDSQRERTYIQTVSSDSVRAVFMNQYDVNEKEYNDFVIFFNSYKPLVDRQDPQDIIRVMHQTFLKYNPIRE